MSLASVVRQFPLRFAIGTFFLDSGLGKLKADEETAASLQGFTASAFPMAERIEAGIFVKALSVGELALGAALVVPLVPGWIAGAGLTAFAVGTMGLYLNTPGMRREGSLGPSQDGLVMAKDSWLLGAGLTLILDDLLDRFPRR